MTATPRTDAMEREAGLPDFPAFARKLERELAEANERNHARNQAATEAIEQRDAAVAYAGNLAAFVTHLLMVHEGRNSVIARDIAEAVGKYGYKEGAEPSEPLQTGGGFKPGDRVRYKDRGHLQGRCGTVIRQGGTDDVWCVAVDDYPNPMPGQDGYYGATLTSAEKIETPEIGASMHKQGCPALGGYGTPDRTCICGAESPPCLGGGGIDGKQYPALRCILDEDHPAWSAIRAELRRLDSSLRQASSGVAAIAAERAAQVSREGWMPEHDDEHRQGEMAAAAVVYALCAVERARGWDGAFVRVPMGWPWDRAWFKPKDARRDLVRAGALIAAEIDRLDRAAKQESSPGSGQ